MVSRNEQVSSVIFGRRPGGLKCRSPRPCEPTLPAMTMKRAGDVKRDGTRLRLAAKRRDMSLVYAHSRQSPRIPACFAAPGLSAGDSSEFPMRHIRLLISVSLSALLALAVLVSRHASADDPPTSQSKPADKKSDKPARPAEKISDKDPG